MKWQKGSSGNPRGRPLGTNEIGKLRAALARHVPEIVAAMVEAAKEGDTAAAKLILERVVPALKSEELPVTLDGISGSRVEMVAAVVQAIASGTLAERYHGPGCAVTAVLPLPKPPRAPVLLDEALGGASWRSGCCGQMMLSSLSRLTTTKYTA